MSEENQGTTLRDALEANFDKLQESEAPVVESAPAVEAQVETAEAKAERLRDEAGRFAAKPQEQADPVEKPRPQRPSSWKKEYWDHWDKLDPSLAQYLHEREGQFASGVSTYKQEFDRAKPLLEVLAPYEQVMRQYNVTPEQQVGALMKAHHTLLFASPQEKQQMFHKLAQDYGVQLGDAPQVDQQQNWLVNELNNVKSLVNNWQTSQEQAEQKRLQDEIEAFKGDPANVHFEEVKDTMAQLLGSRVVSDLKSAYEQAVWLKPEIRTQILAKQAEDAEKERQAKIAAEAKRAKANQVSLKSATPTTVAKEGGKKGLREHLESNFDELAAGRL